MFKYDPASECETFHTLKNDELEKPNKFKIEQTRANISH